MNNSNRHVDLLDYVRAIAVLMVLSFHALGFAFGYEDLPWDGWLRDFSVPTSFIFLLPFSFGGAGVALFFVVSGFCIHLSFQQQGREWRSFWIRRFFRIYPAYFAAIVFSLACLVVTGKTDLHNWPIWEQTLSNLFLVQNASPMTFMGFNGSLWSLAIEAQLYLIYPLLLVLVSRLGWRATMVTLALGECLIRGADGLVDTLNADSTVWGRVTWGVAQSPLGYWFSWALGAWLAEAFLKKQPLPFAKAPTTPWLILAFASYFIKPILPYLFPLSAIITAIVISKILSGALRFQAPSFLSGILTKIAHWSYSTYLLHQPLLFTCCLVIDQFLPGENVFHFTAFLLIMATSLIIFPIGALWYNIIEVPAIHFGTRLIQKQKGEQLSAPLPRAGGFYLRLCAFAIAVIGSLYVRVLFVRLSFESQLKAALLDTTQHDFGSALNHYHQALQINRNSVIALNNTAWLLATAPDAGVRDGPLAMTLAKRACELTRYAEPETLGTLAAADAEAGIFQEAIANAQKARSLATSLGQTDIAIRNGQLIELYKARKPFHEGSEPASKIQSAMSN